MAPSGEVHMDIAFAVVTTAGGVLGYVKKKSLPSVGGWAPWVGSVPVGYHPDGSR